MAIGQDTITYQMHIGGRLLDAASGTRFESLNPYTGKPWALVPDGGVEDVDRAVEAARAAFENPDWKKTSAARRGHLLRRLGDMVHDHVKDLAQTETRDNGKLIREMLGQARKIPDWYYYYSGAADKIQGDTIPLEKTSVFNYTLREPIGVVGALIPWNSPLLVLAFVLAPAVAAGNTVVCKPSEHASVSTLEFAKLVEKAGFPQGVFNVVTGLGRNAGAALAGHPGIGKLALTGGRETGKTIAHLAADNLTPLLLELGGKNPNIVFEDADIGKAVNGCIAGIFGASGQTCSAGSRLFLHEKLHDEFLERLVERTKQIRIGDPSLMETEMGPLATKDQLAKVERFVQGAIADGADLVYGGTRPNDPLLSEGWFYLPTIFDAVLNNMEIAREEVFGPVLSIIDFSDEDEVVQHANDTDYGLVAGVWTHDVRRAHRVAKQLAAGTVFINMYRGVSVASPFGGYKQSGYGREMGLEGLREFTQVKSVWLELSDSVRDPFILG